MLTVTVTLRVNGVPWLAYGRCPLSCGAVPGWVVPWDWKGGRSELPYAVRLGAHPWPHGPGCCLGSGGYAPPLPLGDEPLSSVALSLQRAALEPVQGELFTVAEA